jgi:probable HAF family extracellular repeat protein
MKSSVRIVVALLWLLLLAGGWRPGDARAASFDVTVYEPLGVNARPLAISSLGHLAGSFSTAGTRWADYGPEMAYVTSGGGVDSFGELRPWFAVGGMSRHDSVAGTAPAWWGQDAPRAHLYVGGEMFNLGTLGGPSSRAMAVNDAQQVVGASLLADGREHAFVWDLGDGMMRDLGTPAGSNGSSAAADINNLGQIVGDWSSGGARRAFWYEQGVMRDLGTLGGASAGVMAMSEAGHLLAVVTGPDGAERNVIWHAGVLTDLAPDDSFARARDVNSLGQAVGASFLWSGGERLDINAMLPPGWSVRDAAAINDRGQIAAVGCLQAQCNGVVLTPVPEPAQALLLLAGFILLGRCYNFGFESNRNSIDASTPTSHFRTVCAAASVPADHGRGAPSRRP